MHVPSSPRRTRPTTRRLPSSRPLSRKPRVLVRRSAKRRALRPNPDRVRPRSPLRARQRMPSSLFGGYIKSDIACLPLRPTDGAVLFVPSPHPFFGVRLRRGACFRAFRMGAAASASWIDGRRVRMDVFRPDCGRFRHGPIMAAPLLRQSAWGRVRPAAGAGR